MDYNENDVIQDLKVNTPSIILIPEDINDKSDELTNDEKLENLKKLISEADKKFESDTISKKMVK